MTAGPTTPVISVVIPTFNRREMLPAALASVLAQRDCPPYEVIVVDDASDDGTDALLARLPVRVVRRTERGGVAWARHTGAGHARGELLAFHDSDDVMLGGRLGHLAAFLDAHPAVDAVFANGEIEDAGGSGGRSPVVPRPLARCLDRQRITLRHVVRDGLPVFLQTALIRRRAFDAAGGFDTGLARHADLDLACRLTLSGHVVFLDMPVFRYLRHGGNQTRDRLPLREGMVAVMRRLRDRHPEAVEQLGYDWFLARERRHLYRIAWRHWMRAWTEASPGALVTAGAALRQAIGLERRPSPGRGRRPTG